MAEQQREITENHVYAQPGTSPPTRADHTERRGEMAGTHRADGSCNLFEHLEKTIIKFLDNFCWKGLLYLEKIFSKKNYKNKKLR